MKYPSGGLLDHIFGKI